MHGRGLRFHVEKSRINSTELFHDFYSDDIATFGQSGPNPGRKQRAEVNLQAEGKFTRVVLLFVFEIRLNRKCSEDCSHDAKK